MNSIVYNIQVSLLSCLFVCIGLTVSLPDSHSHPSHDVPFQLVRLVKFPGLDLNPLRISPQSLANSSSIYFTIQKSNESLWQTENTTKRFTTKKEEVQLYE